MPNMRVNQNTGKDLYDDLIEIRRKNLLKHINEILRYSSETFSSNDDQADHRLNIIHSMCHQIIEHDDIPSVEKQSFKEVKMLMNAIREIYHLSSTDHIPSIFGFDCRDII